MYVSTCVYVRTRVCVWHDPLETRKWVHAGGEEGGEGRETDT